MGLQDNNTCYDGIVTKKYGFTPNNIDGYNQCIADIKSKLIGDK